MCLFTYLSLYRLVYVFFTYVGFRESRFVCLYTYTHLYKYLRTYTHPHPHSYIYIYSVHELSFVLIYVYIYVCVCLLSFISIHFKSSLFLFQPQIAKLSSLQTKFSYRRTLPLPMSLSPAHKSTASLQLTVWFHARLGWHSDHCSGWMYGQSARFIV